MSIEKLRNLAKYGVLTDPDPYDLPPEALSIGVNVRFRNGYISSGPVFRSVLHVGDTNPRYSFAFSPNTQTNYLFIGYEDGTVTRFQSNAETAYTLTGYTPSSAEATWTSTMLADVVYVNRSDRVPWFLRPSDATFQSLSAAGTISPVGWDPTWSCSVLRTCANTLVALNVTKGATNYPTMIKTSAPPINPATIPLTWDQTAANTLATENTLAQMNSGISDACTLGSFLVIYGSHEAWLMFPVSNGLIFDYQKLPFSKGSINANCSFELDGKNFVFGVDDIWMHDGNSEKSLCDEKTRDFIFGSINVAQAQRCFVQYNAKLNEMYFCYVSGDAYVNFLSQNGINGCNRAATLNLTDMTWTFDDLPSVFSACSTVLSNSLEYATVTSTYATIGGSYQDQEDGLKRAYAFVGESSTTYNLSTSLYAFDPFGANSDVAYPVDPNATARRYAARVGLDMDQISDIRGYKVISTVYPQARVDTTNSSLMISIGASDFINNLIASYQPYQPYDGMTNYKLDYNAAGRWLAYQILFNDYHSFSITGFDLDLKVTGEY